MDLTSITVTWGEIPSAERNREIFAYAVKYQKSGSQSDDVAVRFIDVAWERKLTLRSLEVGTKYLIQVAGIDGYHKFGVYSNALEVETNQCKFQIL